MKSGTCIGLMSSFLLLVFATSASAEAVRILWRHEEQGPHVGWTIGGLVDAGMSVYNFLRGIPVKVSTYNDGSVDSIASVIYCAGTRRLATPHCKFLIHGITWTFAPSPQGLVVTEHQLREHLEQIEAVKRTIASVIAEATGKTPEQVTNDMANSLTLTADDAESYGLVHELSTVLVPPGAQVIGIR